VAQVTIRRCRKSPLPTSLALELLVRLAACREQLKEAAEQLRQSLDDEDASRIAQETTYFLTHWIESFQGTAQRLL
jgi:hypothetical protein